VRLYVAIALAGLLAARSAGAIDVTACGQTIPAGEVGELRFDLRCLLKGVRLEPQATLLMNGFTLTGGGGNSVGVECLSAGRRQCVIQGPGELREFWAAVNCGGCSVEMRDVVVRANENGVYIPLSGKLIAKNVVVSENAADGIWATGVRGQDIEASRNGGAGVSAMTRLRVRRLEATNNGGPGVRKGNKPGRLVDSVIAGNGTADEGYDIVSIGKLRLVRTTCGTSAKIRFSSQEEYDVVGSFGCADD
jgi:hypothetical protein